MSSIVRLKGETVSRKFCDFCGKSERQVQWLIESDNEAHICNECVSICVEVIARKDAERAASEGVAP